MIKSKLNLKGKPRLLQILIMFYNIMCDNNKVFTCRGYHEWLSYFHKELNNTDTHHILYKNLHLLYRTMSRLLIYIGKSWLFSRLIDKNWDFLTPPSLCIPVQIMSARQMKKWSSQHPAKWKILLTANENDLECIFHPTINL